VKGENDALMERIVDLTAKVELYKGESTLQSQGLFEQVLSVILHGGLTKANKEVKQNE
jgi:hypothetical protein